MRGYRVLASILAALLAVLGPIACAAAEGEDTNMQRQMLGLSSISNARQLGGYPAADGRRVKDGVLLRSGTIFGAAQDDLDILTGEYELQAVIDLRTEREAAQNPDPAMDGVRYFHLPLMEGGQNADAQAAIVEIYRLHGDNPGMAYVKMLEAGALSDEMYTGFFDSENAMDSFRRMFDILLEGEEGAVLWHCTGGKDRAGLASVLVLSVLGVDEETILADFALTNEVLRQRIDSIVSAASAHTDDPDMLEQVAALAGVSVECMQLVFDRAESECGSMLAFVQQKVGLTDDEVAALRELYLE